MRGTVEIDVGRTIGGKYELVRLLGKGSMGEVWVAHHKTLGEHVALKLLTRPAHGDRLEDQGTAAARFRFEAQVAARLSRKTRHIVSVTDHGEEEGLPYLAMELLEGETLESLLLRDRRLPLELVTTLAGQVGRALTTAHAEGVFHRDLKPANVFLARDEEGKILAKLLDFGIARALHAHKAMSSAFATAEGVVFGTPSYMSPEQARASSRLDHRCDLWALATMLYQALSGDLPVEGTDTDQLLQNLCAGRILGFRARAREMPDALDPFFARAFAEAPGDRFQTAAELGHAFEQAAGGGVSSSGETAGDELPLVESAPGSVLDRQPGSARARRRTRTRVAIGAGGGLLLMLAAGGIARRVLLAHPAIPPSPAEPVGTSARPPRAHRRQAWASLLPPPRATGSSRLLPRFRSPRFRAPIPSVRRRGRARAFAPGKLRGRRGAPAPRRLRSLRSRPPRKRSTRARSSDPRAGSHRPCPGAWRRMRAEP